MALSEALTLGSTGLFTWYRYQRVDKDMTAIDFANHLDGYVSRVLSGFKLYMQELSCLSQISDEFGALETMGPVISRITPLFRRGEANV
ncbi:MAG: hypothetical protein PHN90_06710 [Methanothrix sp.]|jgi:hypothetical protein|nr:hypothetical protein [Methanothrix sp.]NLX39207.1 hypothetical protein [Methanothrix sp.]HNR58744.1 hypothetical protein [Methanothrix sp.]HOI69492.1 hypothetical protein [Methanothrix sp.]HPY73575.1 hypothetical protein [Methanothrix sp.]